MGIFNGLLAGAGMIPSSSVATVGGGAFSPVSPGDYRGYQLKVSEVELAKRKADAKYLEGLQNQRPQYAELGSRLIGAESRASQRQREIKARVTQLLKGV